MQIAQTTRENPVAAINSDGQTAPTVRDALRKVLNSLQTLILAAERNGDTQALLCAGVCLDVLIPARGQEH